MKRLFLILLRSLTVLSLLLCLATVVFWIRADDRSDRFIFHADRTNHMLIASPVGVEYFRGTHDFFIMDNWQRPRLEHFRNNFGDGDRPFIYRKDAWGESFNIALPYWCLCLITAIAPAT